MTDTSANIDEMDLFLEEMFDEMENNDRTTEIQNLSVNDYFMIVDNFVKNKWLIDAIEFNNVYDDIYNSQWEELAGEWAETLKQRWAAVKKMKEFVLDIIRIYNNEQLYYNLYLKYNILPALISTTKWILDYWVMKNIQNKENSKVPIKVSKVWIPNEIDYFNDKETLQQTFDTVFNEEIKTSIETYLSNWLMNFDINSSAPYIFTNEDFWNYFSKYFDTEAIFDPYKYYLSFSSDIIDYISNKDAEIISAFFSKNGSTIRINNKDKKDRNTEDNILFYKIKKSETWKLDYQEGDIDFIIYFKKNKRSLIRSIAEKIKNVATLKGMYLVFRALKDVEYLVNKAINLYVSNSDILPHKTSSIYSISPEVIIAKQITWLKLKKWQIIDEIDYSEIYNRLSEAYKWRIDFYDNFMDIIEISRWNVYKEGDVQKGYKAVIDLSNDMNAPTKVRYNINISYFSSWYDINKELLYNTLIRIPIDKLLSFKIDLLKDKSYKNLFLKPLSYRKFNNLWLVNLLWDKPYIREVYEFDQLKLNNPTFGFNILW